MQKNPHCELCSESAVWKLTVGSTHTRWFCREHARKWRVGFASDLPGTFWEKIVKERERKRQKKHPLDVPCYESRLEELAQLIFRMRYDRVSDFINFCSAEIRQQANNDLTQGRTQLSVKLNASVAIMDELQKQFAGIFDLCKPYMTEELD